MQLLFFSDYYQINAINQSINTMEQTQKMSWGRAVPGQQALPPLGHSNGGTLFLVRSTHLERIGQALGKIGKPWIKD